MIVEFKGWRCILLPGKRYLQQDRIALQLVDVEDGEPIATASVNIAEEDLPMEDNEVFIKNYSENEGMTDALIAAGVISPEVIKTVQTGFVEVSSYLLTEQAYNHLTQRK